MKKFVFMFFPFITLFYLSAGYALNRSSCSTFLNRGWFKKYEYQGVDTPVTKASKKLGTIRGSFAVTTENTTASSDPGHSTVVTTANWQCMSSWGPCSWIGLQELKEHRDQYIVQNRDEVLKEISEGRGEHLNVIAELSACNRSVVPHFTELLQHQMGKFIDGPPETYGVIIDGTINSDSQLSKNCEATL